MTFVDGILDATRSNNGGQHLVPWSSVAVKVGYRESAYAAAGIDAAPTTWSEWTDAMAKLQRASDVPPVNVSLRGDDAGTWWLLTNKLNATLRPLTEQINLLHADGWAFDANDVDSVAGETYTVDELYVAFTKGLIDPAQSAGYRAAVEQVLELVPFLNADTSTSQPADVAAGFSAGTIPQLISVGDYLATASADAENTSDVAAFDLPTITKADWSGLTAGGENPLAGPRNGFVVNASSEHTAEAIAFLKFLTQASTVSDVYALQPHGDPSAIAGVVYPDGSVLVDGGTRAFAEISPYGFGMPPTFDSEDFDAFNAQWQKLLTGNSTVDEFLADRSASNLAALERNLALQRDSIDQAFIDAQLGE